MDRAAFTQLLIELRPSLHRYIARMTGSVVDGEDVLQDALARALEAFLRAGPLDNPGGWVFRIAHNTTLDFLRRQARERALPPEESPAMSNPAPGAEARLALAASVRTFLRLSVAQRSSVLLMDVLGYRWRRSPASPGRASRRSRPPCTGHASDCTIWQRNRTTLQSRA